MSKVSMTIAASACAVSLILGLAAIATPKWLVQDVGLSKLKYGLFGSCTNDTIIGEVKCGSYTHTKDWILVTSAFVVTGLCGIILALLFALLVTCCARKSNCAAKSSGRFAILGGLSKVIGTIIWALKYRDDADLAICNLSVGFFLANASAILSVITGILQLLCSRAVSDTEKV